MYPEIAVGSKFFGGEGGEAVAGKAAGGDVERSAAVSDYVVAVRFLTGAVRDCRARLYQYGFVAP